MKGATYAWAWRIGAGLSLLTALALSAGAGKPPKPPPPSTPEKIVYVRSGVLYTMNTDGTSQATIPGYSGVGQERYPRWSPNGAKIAYVAATSGTDETWVMNRDGTGRTQLTDFGVAGGFAYPASYSPDGQIIPVGYTVNFGASAVYLFPAGGGAPTPVASAVSPAKVGLAHQPWSPDLDPTTPGYQGKLLLHVQPDYAVAVVDISIVDGVVTVGAEAPVALYTIWSLAWSPDGSRMAFGGMGGLYVADVTGYDPNTGAPMLGPALQLVPYIGQTLGPSWSPDSTEMAFESSCLNRNWEIYKVKVPAVLFDPDTGAPSPMPALTNLTNDRRASDGEPAWSPTLTP